jgi:hypothetical protein
MQINKIIYMIKSQINSPKLKAISPLLKIKKSEIKIIPLLEADNDDFFEYY